MELFDFTMNTGPELQHSQISRFFGAIVDIFRKVVAFSDCNRKDKPLDSHDPVTQADL